MAGPRGEQCDRCYFWELFASGEGDDDEKYDVGSCRRFPPTIPYEGDGRTNPFTNTWTCANTKSIVWCGEFKPRERA